MKIYEYILSATILLVCICGCARKSAVATAADESEPLFLAVRPLPEGGYSLISLSPFDGSRDTLIISRPLSRLIVMSTSHAGFLRAIGALGALDFEFYPSAAALPTSPAAITAYCAYTALILLPTILDRGNYRNALCL